MTCPRLPQIAAAVTTDLVDDHVAACLVCRRELASQRGVRDALRRMPVPVLAASRRRELAAETLARADQRPPRATRRWLVPASIAAVALAASIAAAAVVVGPAMMRGRARADTGAAIAFEPPVATAAEPLVAPRPRAIAFEPPAPPPERAVGAPRPEPARHDPRVPETLRAFREAWLALRAGRDADAVALFDTAAANATVAEEAVYWAAIAATRAGDRTDGRARLRGFVQRFPRSPYVDQARRVLAP